MNEPQFKRRARITRTEVAVLRRYATQDGRWAVVEIKSLFGLCRRWLAVEILDNGNEFALSTHRSRRSAEAACRQRIRARGGW